MRTNEKIFEVRNKIIEEHGRIENIIICDKDPAQGNEHMDPTAEKP